MMGSASRSRKSDQTIGRFEKPGGAQSTAAGRSAALAGAFLFCSMLAGLLFSAAAPAQEPSSLWGARGVQPFGVRQGEIGSCYFYATIASIAKVSPDTLRKAIDTASDGSYTVHFASGPDESVYPEDVQFGREKGYDISDGDWVLVLERGYAQHVVRLDMIDAINHSETLPSFLKPLAASVLNHSGLLLLAWDRSIRSAVRMDGSLDRTILKAGLSKNLEALHIPSVQGAAFIGFLDDSGFFNTIESTVKTNGEIFGAYRYIGNGGSPRWVMVAFLGKGETLLTQDERRLRRDLEAVHDGKAVMTAATDTSQKKVAVAADSNWWVDTHAFSVLAYDPDTQTVFLRNPWGRHPEPLGYFSLPFADFVNDFYVYAVAPIPQGS